MFLLSAIFSTGEKAAKYGDRSSERRWRIMKEQQ
jgi:hypothetical protein